LSALEGRLFKEEQGKSNKWDETLTTDVEEQIIKNTYLNAQMSQFADYSNLQNKLEKRRLNWMDESGGKSIVESTGIAASTKDSLTFMISSIRPINRLQDMSANAKGPFQPPIFAQPLKLKSVLKNSKEKFQLITPNTTEKNVKRPQSCGGVRQRNTNTLIENSSKTINSDLNEFKQIRNNFTN